MARTSDWVVVFDFDGTMIPKKYGSLITVVDHATLSKASRDKMDALRAKYLAQALDGKLPYSAQHEWMRETIEIYAAEGLTISAIVSALHKVKLREGVYDCLLRLAAAGVPVAVISYGITEFIDAALRINGCHSFVSEIYAANLDLDDRGRVTNCDRRSIVLPSNKGRWSRVFADGCGVEYERILAVGDSGGDEYLGHLKRNRLLIADDDHEALKLSPLAGEVIVTQNFDPVLHWIFKKMSGPA